MNVLDRLFRDRGNGRRVFRRPDPTQITTAEQYNYFMQPFVTEGVENAVRNKDIASLKALSELSAEAYQNGNTVVIDSLPLVGG
jgi:hypothetical protein